jgi:membrane protease YdiL (CAAX protease family)
MENQLLINRHPVIQLLMFALIALISVMAVTLVSLIAGLAIFRIPFNEWMNVLNLSDPGNIPALKFMQITQALSLFVIPPVIFGWFALRHPWKYLEIDRKFQQKPFLLVLLIAIAILPVMSVLAQFNQKLELPEFLSGIENWMRQTEDQAGLLTEKFLTVTTWAGFLVNILMIVLIPAFGEEFFFRGVLQKIFSKWFRNPHVAIIFVAIVFSAFHLQFYGFLVRFALGVLFGYLFYWSGNLWYPVLAHLLNNLIPVTLAFFLRNQMSPAEIDQVGSGPGAWLWAIPALLISTGAILAFYNQVRSQDN